MSYSTKYITIEAKASIGYIIAALLSKGLSIITLPVFTRMLTTADMGVVSTFTSWFNILYVVVTLSLTTASFNVAMIEYPRSRDKYQAVCLQISAISSICFALIYTFFYTYFNKITSLTTPLFVVQIFLFLVNPALDSWYARQRYEYKYKSVVLVSVIVSLLSTVFSIIVIGLAKKTGITALGEVRVISQNLIVIIVGIFFFGKILKNGKLGIDKSMALFSLRLSIPLIVHSLAKNILDTSDRLMVAKICGESDAGIYGTIHTISLLALIVWNAINSAIIPILFKYLKCNNMKNIRKISNLILLLFSGVTIIATLLAPEILFLLTTKEYMEAMYLMPAIISGVYMTALYGLYGNFLIYAKRTELVMLSTVFAAALNVLLNYIFISRYGYIAAAYTTLVCFLILALLQGLMQFIVYRKVIISNKIAISLSISTISICLMCNILYNYTRIRLLVLAVIFVILIINRKKFFELLTLNNEQK